MKYVEKTFQVPLGGRRFGRGWDVAFAGACDCSCHGDPEMAHSVACCFVCDQCHLCVRIGAESLHARVCHGQKD